MSKIIMLDRGDSLDLPIYIKEDILAENVYMLQQNDAVYLGILGFTDTFENAIIRKKYTAKDQSTSGLICCHLGSKETYQLEPGTYYYEIKIRRGIDTPNEFVKTLVNSKLVITK